MVIIIIFGININRSFLSIGARGVDTLARADADIFIAGAMALVNLKTAQYFFNAGNSDFLGHVASAIRLRGLGMAKTDQSQTLAHHQGNRADYNNRNYSGNSFLIIFNIVHQLFCFAKASLHIRRIRINYSPYALNIFTLEKVIINVI